MKHILSKKLTIILVLVMLLSPLLASDYYTGRGQEDKNFFMLEPAMKNVGAGERAWLPSAISSPLKTSLKLFTGMTPVNFENTAKIQEIQKKVESGAYDASRAVIEAGMLQDADYGVFVTVTKTGSTYQLAVSITNLTTGREEATCSVNNIAKETDLQDAAINAAIIQLAPQLGVTLTSLGLYTLSNSSDGSLDEQIALAKQEAASYQATIDALNRELSGFTTASALTDQEIIAKKAAAETEMQLYKQRQEAAQLKAQRLLEQKQKADEEAMAATARSAEATKKLGQLSTQAEEIAAQVRAMQNKQLSVEDRITIIENKKAAYMRIVQQVEEEVADYYQQASDDYLAMYVDPDDPANYPAAYYKDGVFNRDYRQMLIDENVQRKMQLDAEAQENATAARRATDETLAELLDEIRADLKSLSQDTFTLSSLEYPEIFNISSYNTNSYSWNAEVLFTIFNQFCPLVSLELSYEDVTGDPLPALKTRADFDEYAATYDIYDAMFRMGTPFLTLTMDYTVMSDDDDHPSNYFICLKSYKLIRTTDNKVLKKGSLSGEDIELQYYPITDMRSIGETVAVNEIRETEKKQEAAKQAEEERIAERQRIAEQKELEYWLQPDLGYGPGIWAAGTWSKGAGEGMGFDVGVDLKFPGFSLNMGAHSIPTACDTTVFAMDLGFLRDKEINLLGKKSNWFWGVQFGPAFYESPAYSGSGSSYPVIQGITMTGSSSGGSSSGSSDDEPDVGFSLALNAGLFIPLSWRTALKMQYSTQLLGIGDEAFWYDRFSIGIALFLIEGESAEDFWGD